MKNDAEKEVFEHIELFGKPALFTNDRIDRDTVPDGLFCYDLRGVGQRSGKADMRGIARRCEPCRDRSDGRKNRSFKKRVQTASGRPEFSRRNPHRAAVSRDESKRRTAIRRF